MSTTVLSPPRQTAPGTPASRRPSTPRRRKGRLWNSWVARWISPVAIVAAWQVASATGVLSSDTLSAPSDIVSTAWHLISDGQLTDALVVSLRRAAAGFAIGAPAALVLGGIPGLSRAGDALVDPPMQMIRTLPLFG